MIEYAGRDEHDPLAVLVHVRHHCFRQMFDLRGKQRDESFRMAFRTLNSLYNELKGQPSVVRGTAPKAERR